MSDMYRAIILELYRNPLNKGTIENPDARARDANTSCGDEIEIYLKFDKDGNKLMDAKFDGKGCAISQASVSLLTEEIKGARLDELKKFTKQDALDLLGIQVQPARLKCALLGYKVFKLALLEYLTSKDESGINNEAIQQLDLEIEDA